MKVTARLVDVHTGKIIWADSYDYSVAEPDRTQTEASRQIAAQIAAHLAVQSAFPNTSH